MAKRKFTDEELENDPSLKWCPYRTGELVWSDELQLDARFVRYGEGRIIYLSTINGISEYKQKFDCLKVRRYTASQP